MSEKIIAYKAMDKNMTCRGKRKTSGIRSKMASLWSASHE